MIGILLIGAAVATSLLLAVTARLPSVVSTLLVAYVAFVANLGLVTLALSPFHWVTRAGLAVTEGLMLAGTVCLWWALGRARPQLATARAAARELVSDPVTLAFLLFVAALLAYELVLALFVPPNNGDSVGYHLPRAADWAQHGGIEWIENSPSPRLNAFQPLAEQQILYLFVATGSGALFALPQYLAGLAILVAIFGSARRLGFAPRPSACAALLFATFSLPALESSTAQNDLVAASLPAAAACLLLAGGPVELAVAGVAAGLGLGVKLTTVFALPVLVWLALLRGRRLFAIALGGGIVGFVAVGMWGYVLNYTNDGELLGKGTEGLSDSPGYPESVAHAFYLAYGLMDASVLSSRLIHVLAVAGVVLGLAVAGWALWRRRGPWRAAGEGIAVAIPFVAALLVIGAAGAISYVAGKWGFPLRSSGGIVDPLNEILNLEYTRMSNEDFSAFGPVGIVAFVAVLALTVVAFARRRADLRHLALVSALPLFLILTSLFSTWNPFLIRFFLVPAALAAPLLALLFRNRTTTAAYLVATGIAIVITITNVQTKPFDSYYGFGHPWTLSQVEALHENTRQPFAEGLAEFRKLVPQHACVGAVLDDSDPSYVIYGPHFDHRVVYLSRHTAVETAPARGLRYVVISEEGSEWVADLFAAAGWRIRPMGGWILASERQAGSGRCT